MWATVDSDCLMMLLGDRRNDSNSADGGWGLVGRSFEAKTCGRDGMSWAVV